MDLYSPSGFFKNYPIRIAQFSLKGYGLTQAV